MVLQRFFVIVFILALPSCGSDFGGFGSGIDRDCLSRNSDQYPDPSISEYALPYGIGESFQLGQGNCTNFTHSEEEMSEFAFDFVMDIGTPIHAARGGSVAAIEERFFDNNGNENGEQENFILIEHNDGTLAFYVHLTNNGAMVELGQEVNQGDFIGFSGNTGFSTAPHLHFEVIELNEQCFTVLEDNTGVLDNCPSIPVSFSNAQPNDRILVQGLFYTAL